MEWRKDRGSGTRGAWEGLCASVLLHVAVAAMALFAISGAPPPRTPVLVDLTIGGPWESGDSAVPVPGVAPRRTADAASPEPPAVVHAPFSPPVPAPEARPAQPVEAAPVLPAPAATTQAGGARASSAPASGFSGTSTDAGVPGTAPSGATVPRALPGTGTGTGEAGEMRGKAAGRYLERDYAYIRDAIQRGIAYPSVARKMGWEGKVVVAFLILPDGSVRDVRVVKGSGHPALDRGAVDAVRNAAPFPRPPAEAEIITPVVYRLD